MKRLIVVCLCCLLIGACTEKVQAPQEGRLSIYTRDDLEKSTDKIKPSKSSKIKNWPLGLYNAQNNKPKSNLSNQVKKITSISIGKGIKDNSTTLASPIILGDKIYTLDSEFTLQVTDINEHKIILRKKLASIEGTSAKSLSLVTDAKNLYAIAGNGFIIATDLNGETIWDKNLNTSLRSGANLTDGKLYIISLSNDLYVLESKTGKEIWKYPGEATVTNLSGIGTPAISNDKVIMPTTTGKVNVLDAQTGILLWDEVLWQKRTYNPILDMPHITASPVIEKDIAYLTGNAGKSGAYNLKSGSPLYTLNFGASETPAIDGNALFIITNQNDLIAINKKDGLIFWKVSLESKGNWYGPVVLDKSIVVASSQGDILFYETLSGKELRREKEEELFGSPIASEKNLVFLTRKGNLLIYQ